jgi:hypothetical protein
MLARCFACAPSLAMASTLETRLGAAGLVFSSTRQ